MTDILPINTITYWKEILSQYTNDYLQLLPEVQQQLLDEWKAAGDYSTNMGSRVHYMLEKKTIN